MNKAKIGVSNNLLIEESGLFPGIYRNYVYNDYIESVEKAGHIPVQLPVIHHLEDVPAQIEGLDGIIISGGDDIDPSFYDEELIEESGFIFREVDLYDLALIKAADVLHIPVLGICRGEQIINVAFGGSLYQDLRSQRKEHTNKHFQKAPRYNPIHDINIEKGTFLYTILGDHARVNSFHHQSVKKVADGFTISARASDGVIEGIEKVNGTFMCGVQFHPEMMAVFDHEDMIRLFKAFFNRCLENKS